ncbi:helix-turn-helix domain-containing protein [Streptomyces sp. GMY02]|uniref:helix-turn-helix domain-containing protein n=1 Tax=Streptomyces sp. GMY02 TaxID=1333528 RepID=UPI00349FB78E
MPQHCPSRLVRTSSLRASARVTTIESIARSWGFTSAALFSRYFRETYGTTPSEWRRLSSAAKTLSAHDRPRPPDRMDAVARLPPR